MGILYVVGVPAVDHEHLTLRARRVLNEAGTILAEEVAKVQALLAYHGITVPLVGLGTAGAALELLEDGDTALAVHGWPGEAGCRLVSAAAEGGHEVVAVPGPALPITALILSGLPADAFFYLGELPVEAAARRHWISPATGEGHTLVALASPPLVDVLSDLHQQVGDRPLAIVPASSPEGGAIWRGSLAQALAEAAGWAQAEHYALVLGGAPQGQARWDEERLAAEIELRLERGQGAKEISRQLGKHSGWSRRDVYERVLELTRGRK